jgi:hypothetical protein
MISIGLAIKYRGTNNGRGISRQMEQKASTISFYGPTLRWNMVWAAFLLSTRYPPTAPVLSRPLGHWQHHFRVYLTALRVNIDYTWSFSGFSPIIRSVPISSCGFALSNLPPRYRRGRLCTSSLITCFIPPTGIHSRRSRRVSSLMYTLLSYSYCE